MKPQQKNNHPVYENVWNLALINAGFHIFILLFRKGRFYVMEFAFWWKY